VDVQIRPITADEHPAFSRRLSAAFGSDMTPARQEAYARITELDRTLSAWDGGELVGTAGAWSFDMSVPGEGSVPAAGVTMVSVAPTHRRRGILRSFMARQLDDVAERGEPVAILTASEGSIYSRFGYGPATWYWGWVLLTEATEIAQPSTAGGRVRQLDPDDWVKVLPAIYERARLRHPGEVTFPEPHWGHWAQDHEWEREGRTARFVAVHEGEGGEADGFVSWRVKSGWTEHGLPDMQAHVEHLYGADDEVDTALWEHVVSIDLVRKVHGWGRPVDEPLRWRLDEPRKLQVTHHGDHLWVRLLDIPAAFAARSYDVDDAVVMGVRDPFRPANTGTWRIGADGCGRSDGEPDLELDVADLGSLYLGGVSASHLARAGRVVERTAGALRRTDLLLSSPRTPWCGTHF
jgi:predicted acetyltransferase